MSCRHCFVVALLGVIGGHKNTQRAASEKFAAQFGCQLDNLGLMPRTYVFEIGNALRVTAQRLACRSTTF